MERAGIAGSVRCTLAYLTKVISEGNLIVVAMKIRQGSMIRAERREPLAAAQRP